MFKHIVKIALLLCFTTYGQAKENLHVIIIDSTNIPITDKNVDTSAVHVFLNVQLTMLKDEGFLLASYDSLVHTADTLKAYVRKGQKFTDFDIRIDPELCVAFPKFCAKNSQKLKTKANMAEYYKLNQRIQSYFQNNGYPFVTFSYDSIQITGTHITARLVLDFNQAIRFDSLVLDLPTKTKNKYLQDLLSIKKGQLYNQAKVDDIASALAAQPSMQLATAPYVVFRYDKAYVHIALKEKNASKFNGLVGYLPDIARKKSILVGEANIIIRNILGRGLQYDLYWQRFQSKSQELNTNLAIPYILRSSIGVKAGLSILKQDTSYININRRVDFGYQISRRWSSSLIYEYNTSSVTSAESIQSVAYVPNSTRLYGISVNYYSLNDVFFPSKGSSVRVSGLLGDKILSGLQASTKTATSTQVQGTWEMSKLVRISRHSVCVANFKSQFIWNNKGAIFVNDLYRIGGINDLKGFNEKSFYVDKYVMQSLEYRLLVRPDSYFSVFGSIAAVNLPADSHKQQLPYSIGLGYIFNTPIGVLKVFYSLGKSSAQSISLQNSKIHVGVSNEF